MLCIYKRIFMYFALSILSVLPIAAWASDYPTQMIFRNVLTDTDVAVGEVSGIKQDSEGFIWLGARNGLLRFDGYEFTDVPVRVDPNHPESDHPAGHADDVFEDSRRDLWVSTDSGIFKLDRDKNVLMAPNSPNDLIQRALAMNVNVILEAPGGEILAGGNQGLLILDPLSFDGVLLDKVNDTESKLISRRVNDMVLDAEGNVWMATETGLTELNWRSRQFSYYIPFPEQPNSFADNNVITIEKDKGGMLWLGVENGLYRFNPKTATFKRYQHNPDDLFSIADNAARCLYLDSKDRLWYGSNAGGLNIYDYENDRFVRVEDNEGQLGGLESNSIVQVYEDNAGDFWVGTYPSGVNFHDSSSTSITVYNKSQSKGRGLLADDVGAVIEDSEGNLWVGAGGVTKINLKMNTFEYFSPNPDQVPGGASRIESTAILSGLEDSDGDIWFGTWANGLHLYDRKSNEFNQLPFDTSISKDGPKTGLAINDNVIWSLYQDSQGIIWMGTHNSGLARYDKNTKLFTYFRHDPEDEFSLSDQVVWTTLEDSRGRFWVGTANGLNLMNRELGTFKRYLPQDDDPTSLNNNSILSIYEDNNKRLWMGTDLGLHLYQEETDSFKLYTTKDGLADNGIRSITGDEQGNIWVGTNNGISMLNPNTNEIKSFQTFNRKKIGVFDTGSGIATTDGKLAFGGENGLRVFDPKVLIEEDINNVAVVLTDFTIFTKSIPVNDPENILNKVINQTEKITLDYSKSMFSFKFAALNYRDPDKNRYAYKLEGFDDVWREVGNQRTATYTNIAPGKYTFQVKANSGNGKWNERNPPLTLVVEPPLWRTWWAYLGYLMLVLLIFYFRTEYRRLRKSAETYKTQSITDPLTNIYNRAGISQITSSLFHSAETSKDTAIMILDIDHFKRINDNWGHDAGDYILTNVANTMTQNVRRSDFVGRWGGEEFVLICPSATPAAANLIAEKLRSVVANNIIEINNKKLAVTVSIGVAMTLPGETFEEVFKRADVSLYKAKSSGRNCVIIAEENESSE